MKEDRYTQRGVSASKEDVHKATERLDKGLYPHAFCKIMPDVWGQDSAYCNILHADGAGSKASLAYMHWREHGDLSVWHGVAQDALVMNTDDLLCIGSTGGWMVSSLIGRNKHRIPGAVVAALIEGVDMFVEKLRSWGIQAVFAGGETADIGDMVSTLVVDNTVSARMRRADIIDLSKVRAGDLIVGLSSAGQASYETSYNSGIGSNGLTAARHELFSQIYAKKYPESFDHIHLDASLSYTGPYRIEDKVEGHASSVGTLALSPTRSYVPLLRDMLHTQRSALHGIVHCTGGGQTKVLHFVKGLHVIKDKLFDPPLIFKLIQAVHHMPWRDMYSIFNMGHRMEIYTSARDAEGLIAMAKGYGIEARVIGRVEACANTKLTLKTPQDVFEYSV